MLAGPVFEYRCLPGVAQVPALVEELADELGHGSLVRVKTGKAFAAWREGSGRGMLALVDVPEEGGQGTALAWLVARIAQLAVPDMLGPGLRKGVAQ